MDRSRSTRSASVSSPAAIARPCGRFACIVARARWSALLTAATRHVEERRGLLRRPVRARRAGSAPPADAAAGAGSRPGTPARSSRGRRRRASGSVSRGAISSSSASGYGCSHGTSPSDGTIAAGRWRLRRRRVEADVRGDPVQPGAERRATLEGVAARHARRNVSWTASSASSNEPSIRYACTCSSRRCGSARTAKAASSAMAVTGRRRYHSTEASGRGRPRNHMGADTMDPNP